MRLQPPQMAALDAWIVRQGEPPPSRPEALRRLAEIGLAASAAPAKRGATRDADRAYAKGKAGAAVDRAQSGAPHSHETKAHRKRKLTTLPKELGGPGRAKAKRARSIPAGKLNASNDG